MKNHIFFWIIRKVKTRLPAILMMSFASIGHALLGVIFALGSRRVIDSAITGEIRSFLTACCYQGAIILGILVCHAASRFLTEQLRADLERDWKQKLFHGLLYGEYSAVKEYHSAELLNRMNNDVSKVNDGILTILPSGAAMITKLVAAVVVLGLLDVKFMMLITGLGFVLVVSTAFFRHKLKELNKSVSSHDGMVSGFLQESIEKLLMIQAMDVAGEVESRADKLLDDRYVIQRKQKTISVFANMGISVMSYGAGFLALVWCSYGLLCGHMTFGSLTAVIHLVSQLQAPFVNISGILPKYIAMVSSAERLRELDEIQGEITPMIADVKALYDDMEELQAVNLAFSYGRDKVLTGAEFKLPKGAFAVVTGSSGIGKSTLLKLLLGIFQPDQGTLCVRGKNGTTELDRSTRHLFTYVPQGNLLLSGTLRDNLTIVKPDATTKQIEQALYVSAMEDFLKTLPQGLDTVLGENGMGLSEGQAQRLAIARAVLGDAPILLLDECTSALDETTEKMVLQRLKELPGKTCIAVTHRSAAMSICDWHLELSDGKINAVKV